jgi:hypothetical protein
MLDAETVAAKAQQRRACQRAFAPAGANERTPFDCRTVAVDDGLAEPGLRGLLVRERPDHVVARPLRLAERMRQEQAVVRIHRRDEIGVVCLPATAPAVGPAVCRFARVHRGAMIGAVNRKLVVFVPVEALDRVRDAVFAAGAGRIGDYERCSWYTEGTGTFVGGEGTQPTIGERGREERVPELRLETVFPAERQEHVVAALRDAHPYEEPAFDVYELL